MNGLVSNGASTRYGFDNFFAFSCLWAQGWHVTNSVRRCSSGETYRKEITRLTSSRLVNLLKQPLYGLLSRALGVIVVVRVTSISVPSESSRFASDTDARAVRLGGLSRLVSIVQCSHSV